MERQGTTFRPDTSRVPVRLFGLGRRSAAAWPGSIPRRLRSFRPQSVSGLRAHDLLVDYHQKVTDAVAKAGIAFEVPHPDSWGDELKLFNNWNLQGLDADIAEFSEQNAIDCVDFFIEIMIRAQAVSSQLPTVGGEINVAVIRKDGFRFVSRQEWRHRDHSINIPGVQQ